MIGWCNCSISGIRLFTVVYSCLFLGGLQSLFFISWFFTYLTSSRYFRLLDILAGRKDRKHLSGVVLVNGQKQPENFKCIAGYVVQVGWRKPKWQTHTHTALGLSLNKTELIREIYTANGKMWLLPKSKRRKERNAPRTYLDNLSNSLWL